MTLAALEALRDNLADTRRVINRLHRTVLMLPPAEQAAYEPVLEQLRRVERELYARLDGREVADAH